MIVNSLIRAQNILVSGMISKHPRQGGATWAVLQYILGLRGLGHRVTFIEQIAGKDLLPSGASLQGSLNGTYFIDVVQRYGIADCSALIQEESFESVGIPYPEILSRAKNADVLLNI